MAQAMTEHCNCKVGRVSNQRNLELHELIRDRYGETESLRQTAREVNIEITQSAMNTVEKSIVGSPEMVYDALAGDGCDAKTEAEARDQLTYAGIDVPELTDSYISHVGIKRHLNGCEDIDTQSQQGTTDVDEFVEQVRNQESSLKTLVRQGINRFCNKQVVTTGSFEIRVKTTVRCDECDAEYSVREALDEGSCGCGVDN